MKSGFTLVELLVVVAIIALLMAILLPVMGRAKLQAKVLTVNAELRHIAMALEAYSLDNDSKYLPKPDSDTFMAAGIEDRFNRGYTYKYRSVGTLIYNRTTVVKEGAYLWVPDGFPHDANEVGKTYSNPKESPVSWVLYSEGPRFDIDLMRELNYPVPENAFEKRMADRFV